MDRWSPMPAAATSAPRLEEAPERGWWLRGWVSRQVMAGITDRRLDPSRLVDDLRPSVQIVGAEQVHGGSVAVVGRTHGLAGPIAGCDALLTHLPGVALFVRTADCLPMFFADP